MPDQAREALTAGELADRLDRAAGLIDEIRACLREDAAGAEASEVPAGKDSAAVNGPARRRTLRPA